jgi:DNA-binding IclR family transcriptional regulator
MMDRLRARVNPAARPVVFPPIDTVLLAIRHCEPSYWNDVPLYGTQSEGGLAAVDQHRLQRVFDILEFLAVRPSTVSGVSRELGIPLSSCHDLLQAMAKMEAVSSRGREYSLGPKAIGVSLAVVNSIRVQQVADSHLERLAAESGCDVHLAVRTGDRVVFAATVPGEFGATDKPPLGQALPLHASAAGKLFAAFDSDVHRRLRTDPRPPLTPLTVVDDDVLEEDLRRIRAHGRGISRGEHVAGVVGVAAPVRDTDGQLIAAVHLSFSESDAPAVRSRGGIELMRTVAARIELDLKDIAAESLSQDRTA